ncbi:tape-measure protein [Streptomyces sp. CAU 1734]|uniref:tape-measure protein n=1 Tax=Streptomyces sp. CAU 1734 TaxID=3140360 RepID=UPI0032607891
MSAIAAPALNPLAGIAGPMNQLHNRVREAVRAVRAAARPIREAGTAANRIRTGASNALKTVQDIKTRGDSAQAPLNAVGRNAGTAADGLNKGRSPTSSSRRSAKSLADSSGSVISISDLLGRTIGGIAPLLGPLGIGLTVAAVAVTGINTAMRANPLGFVLALLIPVVDYLVDLAVNSETGQRFMKQVFEKVQSTFSGIKKNLIPVIKKYTEAVSKAFDSVKSTISGVVTGIGKSIGDGFRKARDTVTTATNALTGIVRKAWNGLRDKVRPVIDWITKDIPDAFNRVKNATTDTVGGIGGFLTTGMQTVAGVVKGPIEGIISFANWVIDGLNSLSIDIGVKKWGLNLPKIPMLAEGGVVTPPSGSRPGAVIPLGAVDQLRAAEPGYREREPRAREVRLETFRERAENSPYDTAEDLYFLARTA